MRATLGGDWDLDTREVLAMRKIRCCIAHWRDGVAWADTGTHEYMLRRIRRFDVGAFHRLAMGLALDLERIPEQVGVVHRAGVGRWRERLLAPP